MGDGAGDEGLNTYSGNTGWGSMMFSDGSSGLPEWVGGIQYNHSSDYMEFITNNVRRITILSDGNVGIGMASPTKLLELNTDSAQKPSSSLWAITPSDSRVKKNVQTLAGSLDKLMLLRPVTFEYKDDYKTGKRMVSLNENEEIVYKGHPDFSGTHKGFVAQDVGQNFPEWVTTQSVTYGEQYEVVEGELKKIKDSGTTVSDLHGIHLKGLIPMLVEAIQELKKENDLLKNRVQTLENP